MVVFIFILDIKFGFNIHVGKVNLKILMKERVLSILILRSDNIIIIVKNIYVLYVWLEGKQQRWIEWAIFAFEEITFIRNIESSGKYKKNDNIY